MISRIVCSALALTLVLLMGVVAVFHANAAGEKSDNAVTRRLFHAEGSVRYRERKPRKGLSQVSLRVIRARSSSPPGSSRLNLTGKVNVRDFDVALHVVFKFKEDHDRYQVAERHKQFIAENQANWDKVRVFDSYVK